MIAAELEEEEPKTPTGANLLAALEAWAQVIGRENIDATAAVCRRYGRSTSPWSQEPVAVLQPRTVAEVQEIVRIAGRYHCPLYPISGGKNWGLGDACPTTDGQTVLDLRRLNAIREVNTELGYTVIEAGVTQRQLYAHLCAFAPTLAFDATGAGPNATIVGNIMERGFGHSPYGDRYHHSCNFEVVLADGQLLRTGFGQFANSKSANVLKTGLGPSLDGLFTQSNLGIVTALTVWLMPKPECLEAFAFCVEDENALPEIIDALRPLRMNGILPSTVHIANDLRLLSSKTAYPWELTNGKTPLPDKIRQHLRRKYGVGMWNVLGELCGRKKIVRAARNELRQALRGIARPHFVNDYRLDWANRMISLGQMLGLTGSLASRLESINSAFALLKGEPVCHHLRGGAWRSTDMSAARSTDPLERGDGLIWLSPTLPMTGRDALQVKQLASDVFRRHGFDLLLTFVSISGRGMCCPLTICYDAKSSTERQKAKACYEELAATMFQEGYEPYRLAIQSMSLAQSKSPRHWEVVRQLKETLDPWRLLAPGRYDGGLEN